MSRGPGRIMRGIREAVAAEPQRRFTYVELAKIIYGGPLTHERANAIGATVKKLVAAGDIILGWAHSLAHVKTVQAKPKPIQPRPPGKPSNLIFKSGLKVIAK